MNVEIGTQAAQFPEKEYINRFFLAVYVVWRYEREGNEMKKGGGADGAKWVGAEEESERPGKRTQDHM